MIRVRQKNGATTEVPTSEAVEILGLDGRLAVVIAQDRKGTIHVVYPGDPMFVGYCRVHRMHPAKVHKHSSEVLTTNKS